MPQDNKIVILDFGAANNQQVAKIVRDLRIYCEVLPHDAAPERLAALSPRAIILQRGPAFGTPTPKRPDPAWNEIAPVLDLAQSPDADTRLPALVTDFLLTKLQIEQDWTTERFVSQAIDRLRGEIGDRKVLLAMSGGVDSAVCAMLLHRAVGSRLTSVYVDNGCMRKGESQQVTGIFRDEFGLNLVAVDAESRFLERLAGVRDPERKRKIIGEEFVRVFEEEAHKLGTPDYLAQGTIYPDVIESGFEGGKKVKSHHNVGGLPDTMAFKGIIEPLKYLFKDEVRRVGTALGLPRELTHRQPFPGPGLGVRCLGELTKEKLDLLREADDIFQRAMAAHGLDRLASQYFAVLLDSRSVGMTDGARTYGYTIGLRAVRTADFMTAVAMELPYDFLTTTANEIVARVPGISRVVYDITSKPPGTIEWE